METHENCRQKVELHRCSVKPGTWKWLTIIAPCVRQGELWNDAMRAPVGVRRYVYVSIYRDEYTCETRVVNPSSVSRLPYSVISRTGDREISTSSDRINRPCECYLVVHNVHPSFNYVLLLWILSNEKWLTSRIYIVRRDWYWSIDRKSMLGLIGLFIVSLRYL